MRKYIATATLVLSIGLGALAQGVSVNFGYGLRPTYKRPIQKRGLGKSQVPYGHHSRLSHQLDRRLRFRGGVGYRPRQKPKALGTNVVLNAEQKNILSTANLDDDVEINVNYRTHNVVTGAPRTTACTSCFRDSARNGGRICERGESPEGIHAGKGIDKISEKIPPGFKQVLVRFTVNEQGKTTDAYISVSSVVTK